MALHRFTQAESSARAPKLGDIVLFHPKHAAQRNVLELAAIVQYVADPLAGLVDLCVLTDRGPTIKKDVPRWNDEIDADGWTFRE